MSKLLHKCWTKAVVADGDQRKYGPNWVTSRRTVLRVYEDYLECGNWRIDYMDMSSATLFLFRTSILRIPGYVLTVETPDRTYHFGLNGWGKFWSGELPFETKRESGRLGFTWFSIVVRLILVGYAGYLAWRWMSSH